MKISKKEIKKTIENYNYICTTLQAMGTNRNDSLNVISDYLIILKDVRITENQKNDKCYDLLYTICIEADEYLNNNNFVDYYEKETSEEVQKIYLEVLKNEKWKN